MRARYALLPFWYTLYFQSELSGEPIVKPLWVEFPEDKNSFVVEDQHLVGKLFILTFLLHQVHNLSVNGVHQIVNLIEPSILCHNRFYLYILLR